MMFGRTLSAAGMLAVSASAQNMSFGADNFYQSGSVTLQPVTFKNIFGHTIAGNLFTSKTLKSNVSAPAIVVGHPMGAVKEQSANLYATKLAERGFVTVSFDLPFYGGSSGEPRNAVNPDLYAEAFSAAVDFLGTHASVDRARIGGVGVCGSGSYIISAAKLDSRIRAIATSSMYDMGAAMRDGLMNALSADDRKQTIDDASEQRWAEVDGSEPVYTCGTPFEITESSTEIDREFYDFYRTRRGEFTPPGAENITTCRTLTSNHKLFNFYPFNGIGEISPRPLLFISGDRAHSREFSMDAYALAAQPKELVWVEGAGHVDLYDRVELIPFDKLTQFFQTNLA